MQLRRWLVREEEERYFLSVGSEQNSEWCIIFLIIRDSGFFGGFKI